jgi:serine phosphatase RsbU (regulator of sigma subunit)
VGVSAMYLMKDKKVEKLSSINQKKVVIKNFDFKSNIINYESGSEIFLYTDGIVEIPKEFVDPVKLLENTLELYSNGDFNLLDAIESEILVRFL